MGDGLGGKVVGFVLEHPQETAYFAKNAAGRALGLGDPMSPDVPWGAIAKGALAGVAVGVVLGIYLANCYPTLGRLGRRDKDEP